MCVMCSISRFDFEVQLGQCYFQNDKEKMIKVQFFLKISENIFKKKKR